MTNRSDNFFHCLNYCNLVDLGYRGRKFTWTNERKKDALILEHLDRVVANYEWLTMFSEAQIHHLPSDHCPLLLSSSLPFPSCSYMIFRFKIIWLFSPDLRNIVKQCWDKTNDLFSATTLFTK